MADFTTIANLRGPAGRDGSNVLPTDEAMAQTAADPQSEFATQLLATIGGAVTNAFGMILVPPPSGNAQQDTATLQALISAAPDFSRFLFPGGRYLLDQHIEITKNATFQGAGVWEVRDSDAFSLPDIPRKAPHLTGTVFVQTAAGRDGIQVKHGGTFNCYGVGVLFEGAHRFKDTGHGINVIPQSYSAKTWLNGLSTSTWRDIKVFGHDGSHYAYNIRNPMHCVMENLRSWGGGVLRITSEGTQFNYGNIVVTAAYGYMFCGGTADAFHLFSDGGSTNRLNFVVAVRPQVNMVNGPAYGQEPLTDQQAAWRDSGASMVNNLVIAPDLERSVPGVATPVLFDKDTTVIAAGGYTRGMSFRQEKPYSEGDVPIATPNTAGAGAGNGATAGVETGTNPSTAESGIITLTTGSSASGTGANLVSVAFPTPLPLPPKFVRLTNLGTAEMPQLYARDLTASGFNVRARTALAAATTYRFGFEAVY